MNAQKTTLSHCTEMVFTNFSSDGLTTAGKKESTEWKFGKTSYVHSEEKWKNKKHPENETLTKKNFLISAVSYQTKKNPVR